MKDRSLARRIQEALVQESLPTFSDTGEGGFDAVGFITACEDGTMDQERFDNEVQDFVDSGIWRNLQGSWQRTVRGWIDQGLAVGDNSDYQILHHE